jgi:hypothetical protein
MDCPISRIHTNKNTILLMSKMAQDEDLVLKESYSMQTPKTHYNILLISIVFNNKKAI